MPSSASAPNDDSDLEDLIAKGGKSNVEIESGYAPSSSSGGGGGGSSFLAYTPCGFIWGACRLCCYKCPCLSKCVVFLMALGFVGYLSNALFNPYKALGIFGFDYSAINSAYDLSLSKVDHWCIKGDNDSCKCEDPLEPVARSEFKSWNAAHKANVAEVNLYRSVYGKNPTMIDESTGHPRPPIDVAFLGESVVEAMDGRWLGKNIVKAVAGDPRDPNRPPDVAKVFERLFRKEQGGPVEGAALGVAGDSCANVLWRLQHDEMPYDFNPKVWWLVLGMNDLTRMQCSEEIVVLGILRVVEEIRLRKPDAKIVINSLLPMINYQDMENPKMSDFADFKKEGGPVEQKAEIDKAIKNFFGDKGPDKVDKDYVKRHESGKKDTGFKEHGYGGRFLRKKEKRSKKGKKERQREEDNAVKGPELKKALEKRKRAFEQKDKRIKDKVFKDKEKYRPKKPVSPFLPMIKRPQLPPVWPSVHLINDKLKEFCTKHDDITFFDATPIFAIDEGRGRHKLQSKLISTRGHPSNMGFAAWEGSIMSRLHKLLLERPEKKIEVPPPSFDDDEDTEEDPDVEELEPVHEADDAEAEEDEISGEGEEHVSEGKIIEEPEELEGSGDGEEHISAGKEAVHKEVRQASRDDPGDASERQNDSDDVDDEEAKEREDKKVEVSKYKKKADSDEVPKKKKVATKKVVEDEEEVVPKNVSKKRAKRDDDDDDADSDVEDEE